MKKNVKASGLFQLIDRKLFDRLVDKWEMDKWVRELKTWELTCALITAMTMRLGSYREIEQTLGIPHATLGDALAKRYSGFFMELCDLILLSIRGQTRHRKTRRAIRQILALDSSEVRVHGSLFSTGRWQQRNCKGREAAAKLHVIWNVGGEWVEDFIITGSRHNDSPTSRYFELQSGCTYVFDRAYNNIKFWLKIMGSDSHFITRLKERSVAIIKGVKEAELKTEDGVLLDGIYQPAANARFNLPAKDRNAKFRFVVYRDPLTKSIFYFVSSDWSCPAQEIADTYRKRWAVELLFRWLKGHLDIRYLAAKNTNAIKIQLAIAVLIQLLLQLKRIITSYQGTLWELLREIRTTLARQTLALSESPVGCRWRVAPSRDLASHFL